MDNKEALKILRLEALNNINTEFFEAYKLAIYAIKKQEMVMGKIKFIEDLKNDKKKKYIALDIEHTLNDFNDCLISNMEKIKMNKYEAKKLQEKLIYGNLDEEDYGTLLGLIDMITEEKPIKMQEDIDDIINYHAWCPNCKRMVHRSYSVLQENKFCGMCGKALIWE